MYRKIAQGILVTALLAGTAPPVFALTPGLTDEAPELNSLCQAQPNIRSGFNAVAVNVEQILVSSRTGDVGLPVYMGIGTPTGGESSWSGPLRTSTWPAEPGAYNVTTSANLNTTAVIYSAAIAEYQTNTVSTYYYSFDCHVHKGVKRSGNDPIHGVNWMAPDDEQIYGLNSDNFAVDIPGSRTEQIANWESVPQNTRSLPICQKYVRNYQEPDSFSISTLSGYDGSLGSCEEILALD